jgi:cyclic pyranopterin phosphate synthase
MSFRLQPITDSCGRELRYLRVSVTDRCNLRCRYCMPPQGIPLLRHEDILSYEHIAAVARAAVTLGVTSVRITGGEPLVRRGITNLVRLLRDIDGLDDLSITTNGILLASAAQPLARAGLRRVNISIDSLDPDQYADITRGGDLRAALDGVRAALDAGLTPVKVNAVVFDHHRDDDLRRRMSPFVELARALPVHVRFIEQMPIGGPQISAPGDGAIARIMQALGAASPDAVVPGAGPARYWRLDGAPGSLGLIAPMSDPFCDRCNRLRLTALGELRRCIFSSPDVDLRPLLGSRADARALAAAISRAWLTRPPGRGSFAPEAPAPASMCQVGG